MTWQAVLSVVLSVDVDRNTFCPLQFEGADGFEPGQQLEVTDIFKVGDKVDVAGKSIGKGFQGVLLFESK